MHRVASFYRLIEKFFHPPQVWLSFSETSVTLLDSQSDTGKVVVQGVSHQETFGEAFRYGQVYEVQSFQSVLEKVLERFKNKQSFLGQRFLRCTYAVPAGSSPLQRQVLKNVFSEVTWGEVREVDRSAAVLAWAHAKTKQAALAVLFLEESFSEVSLGVGSSTQSEVFDQGMSTLVEEVQQHFIQKKDILFPRNQVEKMLEAFSFLEVVEEKSREKISVRGQDQHSRTTVTLSIAGEDLTDVYRRFGKRLVRFFRQKAGKKLSSFSGVAVISQREILGLSNFLQQEFGWDWSVASHGRFEVVRGLQYLESTKNEVR